MSELSRFIQVWEQETQKTTLLLRALPHDQYDFRPDPEGRSLGELAWHLAEGDAYMTLIIERGGFDPAVKPPGIERPKTVAELAPGFERIHRDAVARIQALKPEDLDRTVPFMSMGDVAIRDLLWNMVLHHSIHHRGQLSLLCRLAGGRPTPVYGPTREEMPLPRKAAAAAS